MTVFHCTNFGILSLCGAEARLLLNVNNPSTVPILSGGSPELADSLPTNPDQRLQRLQEDLVTGLTDSVEGLGVSADEELEFRRGAAQLLLQEMLNIYKDNILTPAEGTAKEDSAYTKFQNKVIERVFFRGEQPAVREVRKLFDGLGLHPYSINRQVFVKIVKQKVQVQPPPQPSQPQQVPTEAAKVGTAPPTAGSDLPETAEPVSSPAAEPAAPAASSAPVTSPAPERMDPTECDPLTGVITWPATLSLKPEINDFRRAIEIEFSKQAAFPELSLPVVTFSVSKIRENIDQIKPKISNPEDIAFLDRMSAEAAIRLKNAEEAVEKTVEKPLPDALFSALAPELNNPPSIKISVKTQGGKVTDARFVFEPLAPYLDPFKKYPAEDIVDSFKGKVMTAEEACNAIIVKLQEYVDGKSAAPAESLIETDIPDGKLKEGLQADLVLPAGSTITKFKFAIENGVLKDLVFIVSDGAGNQTERIFVADPYGPSRMPKVWDAFVDAKKRAWNDAEKTALMNALENIYNP
ncbi:MAG: hypothetical protein PHZ00_02265 [Candidatus Peribacteraceae bacterium]|nr:hypothetical protein [Candidatus Peribacteraceae bacterium]